MTSGRYSARGWKQEVRIFHDTLPLHDDVGIFGKKYDAAQIFLGVARVTFSDTACPSCTAG
jgi:hypothetical protein